MAGRVSNHRVSTKANHNSSTTSAGLGRHGVGSSRLGTTSSHMTSPAPLTLPIDGIETPAQRTGSTPPRPASPRDLIRNSVGPIWERKARPSQVRTASVQPRSAGSCSSAASGSAIGTSNVFGEQALCFRNVLMSDSVIGLRSRRDHVPHQRIVRRTQRYECVSASCPRPSSGGRSEALTSASCRAAGVIQCHRVPI